MPWKMPGPRVADADVAGPAAARGDLVAVLVVDHRVDAEHARSAAAGLHRLQGWQGAAEESAVLGLPPGVDDDRLALADLVVIPAPDLGLDRLADRGHVLEVVAVLLWFLRPDLAQHPDRRGRGMEDVHPEFFRDPPGPPAVGIVGHPLVDHRRGAQRERPVDDVGVAGDPPDVGHAPVDVIGMDVLVVLRRPGDVGEIPASGVHAALRPAGGAGRVHQEQRRLGRHRHRLDCLPRCPASSSSTKTSLPSAIGDCDAYRPGCRRHTSTLSTCWPSRPAAATASSALTL